ncbi:hypothetical protein ABFS83_03G096400 [Erythranthe nasuta]
MEDWNDVPEELLLLLLENVLGKDRYSFSLVCQSWNRVAKASPYHPSPCLMTFNRKSNHVSKYFQHNCFFRMNFPTLLKDATVRFSNDGWLLMMSPDDRTLFFFDPFNNQTIELPPIPSHRTMYNTICFFHPPTSPNCLIVGILSNTNHEVEVGVLKYGEDRWDVGLLDIDDQFKVSFCPPILHDGKIYFLDVIGNVAWFDMTDGIWSFIIFPRCFTKTRLCRNIKECFLIKPKNEETIFGVFLVHDERKVRVFELSKRLRWKLVEDLRNRVFYVSKTSSFGYTTDDKSMANKIFFSKFHGDKIVFYSMDTQKYHSFEGDYSSDHSYDFEKLDFATWMIPTLPPQLSRKLTSRKLIWCPKVDETTT